MTAFSDYIIYVDESGDHSLVNVYEGHPVFILAFCVFKKSDYAEIVAPAVCSLKFDFWGHDSIVLHSHKIRKQCDEFAILSHLGATERFLDSLNALVATVPFSIIATIIDKRQLNDRYTSPQNPYHLGLLFCLERASRLLEEKGQKGKLTHILVEARGKKEDTELELEFRRIMDKAKTNGMAAFDLQFADKRANSAGLQIADLVAHPIGRHYLNPSQKNRSYEILEKKFHRYPSHGGKGLKIFPKA